MKHSNIDSPPPLLRSRIRRVLTPRLLWNCNVCTIWLGLQCTNCISTHLLQAAHLCNFDKTIFGGISYNNEISQDYIVQYSRHMYGRAARLQSSSFCSIAYSHQASTAGTTNRRRTWFDKTLQLLHRRNATTLYRNQQRRNDRRAAHYFCPSIACNAQVLARRHHDRQCTTVQDAAAYRDRKVQDMDQGSHRGSHGKSAV